MESIRKYPVIILIGIFLLGLTACLHQPTATLSLATRPREITPTILLVPTLPTEERPTATQSVTAALDLQQDPIFGIGMDHFISSWGTTQMVAANITWVRLVGVLWSSIEPTQGTYNWSVLAELEGELRDASSLGVQVILLVHSTPEWARKVAGTGPSCGPIAVDKLPAFGNFMRAMVARYSVAPYNVKYWELWNEEDTTYVDFDREYGCWGDVSDPYFGGGYYADMLKAVYPQIKAANAKAQVLIGGLLLDCDPRGTPSVCATVHPTDPYAALPPMFLEGILKNNGGAYFDGVSFHAYDYYSQTSGQYANPNWASAWNTTGPVLIAKSRFIQGLLSQYSVTGKYLMNTELALICGSTGFEPQCQTDTFVNAKAYYVTKSYAAAMAQGLRANTWYNTLGWRGSALLGDNLTLLPAYTAFQFGRIELRNAGYLGEVSVAEIGGTGGVTGYKFQRGDRRVWVLWSLDGGTHTINLAGVPLAAWDALGVSIIPKASMNVTVKPLYLEWNP
jgi:hypothetical protein